MALRRRVLELAVFSCTPLGYIAALPLWELEEYESTAIEMLGDRNGV